MDVSSRQENINARLTTAIFAGFGHLGEKVEGRSRGDAQSIRHSDRDSQPLILTPMFRLTTLLLFCALLLGAYAATSGWEYVDCGTTRTASSTSTVIYFGLTGDPSYPVQLDSIEISPDPPLPGHDLTVTVKALVTNVIEEGAIADVTVKLGRIKLLQKKFDVCQVSALRSPVRPVYKTIP